MDKLTIIEGNKLIAEFMKYQEGYPHLKDKYGYIQCEEGYEIKSHINQDAHDSDIDYHQFRLDQLKFHESWDWLMPVVVKIKHMQHDPKEMFMGTTFEREIAFNTITKIPIYTSIELVHKQIVSFIKWYNGEINNN